MNIKEKSYDDTVQGYRIKPFFCTDCKKSFRKKGEAFNHRCVK